MVNDDVLIKYERARGHKEDWPEQVMKMKMRLEEVKLGFPGIRNDHLSLVPVSIIQRGDIFIWDPYFECDKKGDLAPLMLRNDGSGMFYVYGIGIGDDSERDPERIKIRWQDTIQLGDNGPGQDDLVYRVDVRPSTVGGPGYYYFFKSYRDFIS